MIELTIGEYTILFLAALGMIWLLGKIMPAKETEQEYSIKDTIRRYTINEQNERWWE